MAIELINIYVGIRAMTSTRQMKQECTSSTNSKKVKTKCGEIAKQKLVDIVNSETKVTGKNKVRYTDDGKDRYNRQVSYCYIGDININKKMVREGCAVAYVSFDLSFIFSEWLARAEKLGIWSGGFENPAEWRKNNKIVAQYSLDGIKVPLGISDYKTKGSLPDKLIDKLPTIMEMESNLGKVDYSKNGIEGT